MKRLLNSLYVTTPGAGLRKDGENVVVDLEGEEIGRVPLHLLGSLVVFGAIWLSPALMGACAQAGISVVLLDRAGRFQARVEGPVSGNVLLRRAQYRTSEKQKDETGRNPRGNGDLGERGIEIVRSVVLGKLANQRTVILRTLRDHHANSESATRPVLQSAAARLADILRRAMRPQLGSEQLRGLEGEAAQVYFSVFDYLLQSRMPLCASRGVAAGRRWTP